MTHLPVDTIADQADVDAEGGATLDVTSYFTDIDSTLTYTASGLPDGLTIDPATGIISGTIDRSASQNGPNNDGEYSVTITAIDGDGERATQTFTWRVTNHAPTANDDAASTDEDTAVSGNVLDGTGNDDVADSDPDGDPLTVVAVNGASGNVAGLVTGTDGGIFTLYADGSYDFRPTDVIDKRFLIGSAIFSCCARTTA